MSDHNCGHDHHCHHHHHYYYGGGDSSGGSGDFIIVIISMVIGLVILTLFTMLLGIEPSDMPGALIAILWVGGSLGIALLIDKLR